MVDVAEEKVVHRASDRQLGLRGFRGFGLEVTGSSHAQIGPRTLVEVPCQFLSESAWEKVNLPLFHHAS